jgi:FKBP12-rapamycin complex-associated protein
LAAFEKKQTEDPASIMALVGRMKCLQGLGEWEKLSQLAREKWGSVDNDVKQVIAPTAAAASWGLGYLDEIDEYASAMKHDSADCSFFRAILSIHRNLFPQATEYINKARELVDVELMTNLNDSYTRAYKFEFDTNIF